MGFAIQGDHRVKMKGSEMNDKFLDLVRELKKLRNMRVTVITIVDSGLGIVFKNLQKVLEEQEISGRTVKISSNSYKIPGDQRRLAVTQDISENKPLKIGIKDFHGLKKAIIIKE